MRDVAAWTLLALTAVLIAGCARPVTEVPRASGNSLRAEIRTETGDILEKYVAAQRRLWSVAGPLLVHNAALCPRRALTPGFTVMSDFDLPDPLRDVAYERMLIGTDPMVLAVIPGTDAWHEGVRPGDTLLTIDGARVRNAADARTKLRKINIRKPGKVTFGFIRDGRAFSTTLPLVSFCHYRLIYDAHDRDINAAASGTSISVTQGMMDFANDRELAVIIGHELAHNIMHHIPKDRVNTAAVVIAGTVIDGLSGMIGADTNVTDSLYALYTHVWSEKFEKEADYVGLYLLARSGGDISAAAPFWRRIAAEHGMDSVRLPEHRVRTHPDSPERFVVLEETRKEITAKIRRGDKLMPNLLHSFDYGRKYWPWENEDTALDEPDDSDLNH